MFDKQEIIGPKSNYNIIQINTENVKLKTEKEGILFKNKMKKILKVWGAGLAVYIDKEDVAINNFKKGEIVEVNKINPTAEEIITELKEKEAVSSPKK